MGTLPVSIISYDRIVNNSQYKRTVFVPFDPGLLACSGVVESVAPTADQRKFDVGLRCPVGQPYLWPLH